MDEVIQRAPRRRVNGGVGSGPGALALPRTGGAVHWDFPRPANPPFAIRLRMTPPSRIVSGITLVVLLAAGLFLAGINRTRVQRVEYVTNLAQPATPPTDRPPFLRHLIVPERNEASFELMAQTQQMLATGPARIRHVDYDNAPAGRVVRSPSPPRWWLGFVAWADHLFTGRPPVAAVESAALYAGPILHGVAFVLLTAFVAWQFGALPAALFGVGLVTFFPLAARFLPGVPDPLELARVCGLAGLLCFLAGLRP